MNNIYQKQIQPSPKKKIDNITFMRLPNGAQYEGQVYQGKPHGRGKMKYINSERYEGDFFQGFKQGKGKYYYMKGQLYIGDWFQNKKQGKGQYFYKNGTIYTGDFAENKKHGHGKIEQTNGSYFEGQFALNNKDKTGVYYDAIKNKKYLLIYENGRLFDQKQISEDINSDQKMPSKQQQNSNPPLIRKKTKEKQDQVRQVLSQQFNSQGLHSIQKQLPYNSHFQNYYLKSISAFKESKLRSEKTMLAENYIDSHLLKKNICVWSIQEVSIWLNQIGFGDCIEDFKNNNIEGDSLLVLDNDDLKQLGVNALGDRRILQREIQFLRLMFKSQCLKDPIGQFVKKDLTFEIVKKIQQMKESQKYLEQNKKPNDIASSSSSSLSSNGKEEKIDMVKLKKNKMSMQSKVSSYLENKGIKLTFLIPKDQIEIIEPIGKGGYGQVFLGRWLGQEVAVKKYLKKQGFRNRHIGHFIEQIQVINKLNHPCIVLYMGMCIYDNEYAMVTQFLSGGSLFDYLHKKKQKLTEKLLVSICKDVSLGMAYLHQKDVLHCDLKSSNLLIDQNQNVKLCDFGLSRINNTKNKMKSKNIRVGTPHWMAPEILKGGKYECPSDIYSFGILLWEMMTGNIPYKDYSTAQIIGMVGNDQNHHISTPNYPNESLLYIFNKCTSRNPLLRPSFKEIVKLIQTIQINLQVDKDIN